VSASVKIPSNYTINLGGGLALNPVEIQGDPDRPLTTLIKGDPDAPVTTLMTGDPKKPLAATVEMLNIPRLSLEDIKDLMTPKLRVQLPNYEQFCFKLFGIEIFSFCLSGEAQVITQPYRPNKYEQCEPDCPDLDDRPFPEDTRTHKTVSV
jgi:hypothetical protein